MKLFKHAFLLAALALSGCATNGGEGITATVTVFHNLTIPAITEEPPVGVSVTSVKSVIPQSFHIVPLNDEQAGSLEYDTYARQLSAILTSPSIPSLKMDYEPDVKKANIIVTMTYGISNGQDKLVSRPIIGQTGGGTTTYHSGMANAYGRGGYASGNYSGTSYTPATYGVVGMNTYTVTNYARGLIIKAYEAKSFQKNQMKPIYEAKVLSTGYSGNIAVVMPAMLRAFGAVYPGQSGATETIEVTF